MAEEDEQEAKPPAFLTVEQCRASLPIKISRREVVRYIKAAGPELYQEHRRQLFLTPEQWALVVKTMHPKGVKRRMITAAERAYQEALERTYIARIKATAYEGFLQARKEREQKRATEKTVGHVRKRVLPGPEAYKPKRSR